MLLSLPVKHRQPGVGPPDRAKVASPDNGPPLQTLPSSTDVTPISQADSASRHPLQNHPELLSCIRLLRCDAIRGLPAPMPRCQDLAEKDFGVPTAGDLVIAVSHAWRNQTHPDPDGAKLAAMSYTLQCLRRQGCRHREYANFFVRGEDLEGAVFAQVGQIVQIVSGAGSSAPCGRKRSERFLRRTTTERWAAFDAVLEIDDQEVTSVQELQAKLADTSQQHRVKLRRQPYGVVNETPIHERGWVFLERFITMVKCGMLDPEQASEVVLSNSPAILEQIRQGADRLREAALLDEHALQQRSVRSPIPDKLRGAASPSRWRVGCASPVRRSNLKTVLEEFLAELETKQFSAASTDKTLLDHDRDDMSPSGDRQIVRHLMEDFVLHLEQHWHSDAAKQRRRMLRFGKVFKAAGKFLLSWESFSAEYSDKLADSSVSNPLHGLLLLFLPPLLGLLVLLPSYEPPDTSWQEQLTFWFLGLPAGVACTAQVFPFFLAAASGIEVTWQVGQSCLMWVLAVYVCSAAAVVIVAARTGVFPAPGACYLGVLCMMLPLLWWCVPAVLRSDILYRVRVAYALVALCAVLAVFGIAFPLLNAALHESSELWRLILVALIFSSKLAFERFCKFLSRKLGGDMMPIVSFLANCSYELNLCVVLIAGFDWYVFWELVAFDVIENLVHLVALWRLEKRIILAEKSSSTHVVETDEQLSGAFLCIVIDGAANLPGSGWSGAPEPYCSLEICDDQGSTRPAGSPTPVVGPTCAPLWGHRMQVHDFVVGQHHLVFKVWHWSPRKKHILLGSAMVDASAVQQGMQTELMLPLENGDETSRASLKITLEVLVAEGSQLDKEPSLSIVSDGVTCGGVPRTPCSLSTQQQVLQLNQKKEYIMARLVLREFTDVLIPAQFLVILVVLYTVQPQFNSTVCNMTERHFQLALLYLAADIAAEVFMGACIYVLLRHRGASPGYLLKALISTNLRVFLSTLVGCTVAFLGMQHSHFGVDVSQSIVHTWKRGSDWQCGTSWK
eukprot:TRINITY_DN3892_c0_g1_i1.p1 TRINITY_DN3892_c0_g1~~TRINITY_DN3892_c0_g1_i1.p1  ORF type:complete len:1014 (+),score=189.47 TRINITY_DN3892_c0_g1_i1:49-3090(+)